MPTPAPPATDDAQIQRMQELLEQQRTAFLRQGAPSQAQREANLQKLLKQVRKYDAPLRAAVSADFGNRAPQETAIGEVGVSVATVKHALKNLGKWMRPEKRKTAMEYKPARNVIHSQPLGCVGIIAPWNYPFYLTVSPLVGALAAGNRVSIKPSEYTPRVADLLDKMLGEIFAPEEVAVIVGGPAVGAAFSKLKFDHLLYTGSTKVGRLVMMAAAENLVPVTLELGGKSPAILSDDYPMDKAVGSIAMGKLFNAGQTCVAPDYAFVPESRVDEFVEKYIAQSEKMYPTLATNADYTSIVSDNHYERIMGLVEEARKKDARITQHKGHTEDLAPHRKIAPAVVRDVNDDMEIMQEEIFGPVLPVMSYTNVDDAKRYVNEHPRPLALYYFTNDAQKAQAMMEDTISGGACINETVFHVAQEDAPFGGVGPSGIGAYHGEFGFKTFSHAKSVFYQSAINGAGLLRPPYGKLVDFMTKTLIGK